MDYVMKYLEFWIQNGYVVCILYVWVCIYTYIDAR